MTISLITHVNTEVMITGLVILLGNKKNPSGIDPVVANFIIDTRIEMFVFAPDARFIYKRFITDARM